MKRALADNSKGGRPERALPLSRLSSIASSGRRNPAILLDAGYWKHQLIVRRSVFSCSGRVRYMCEIPRWLWLTRAARNGCV